MGWKWKKPKWVQKAQKAATNTFVKPIQRLAKKLPPPPPKPRIVQQVQKVAQKAADKVGNAVKNEVKSAGDAIGDAGRAVVKGVENSAKDIGQSIQQSAVGQAVTKAADKVGDVVRPAAPVLQRIGDKLGDAGREAGAGLKRAGDAVGDVVTGRKDIFGNDTNRDAKVKIPGGTMDTGLVDTSGMTPEQKIAYERFLAQRKLQAEMAMSDRSNAYDDLERMRQRFERLPEGWDDYGEPMFPQGIIPAIIKAAGGSSGGGGGGGGNSSGEGVRVADASDNVWKSYDQGRRENRTILDDIIENPVIKPVIDTAGDVVEGAVDGAEKVAKAGADGLKTAWETIRPDRPDTKVFVSTFENWATPDEIDAYRRADHDRNDAEKARIRAIAEERRRTKTKP